MKRKITVGILFVILLASASVFADGVFGQSPLYPEGIKYSFGSQLGISNASSASPAESVFLANGNPDYPVTPGDVYNLSYSDGKTVVTLELMADSECHVAIPSIGTVDGYNTTFKDLKKSIEAMVQTYYPFSSPTLTLRSCGIFSVKIGGEVSYSQYVNAWGLSRLSDLAGYVNEFASTRNIVVTYRDGTKRVYDLYKALKLNSSDVENNPLLSPGCEVYFPRASKIISLAGSVIKPGIIQPTETETLYDIISVYGSGLLNSADRERITVAGYKDGIYTTRVFSVEDSRSFIPSDGDTIIVAANTQTMPYITVTGAVAAGNGGTISSSSESRFIYSFVPGETAGQVIRNISGRLTANSDTSSVYIIRNGQKIGFNASEALTGNSADAEIYLEKGDILVIPFLQTSTVTVTGAVNNPGTFAFVPDKSSDYYINLAGGFTGDATHRIKLLNSEGKKVNTNVIMSDSTIVANKKDFTANLAVAASVLSIVATVLTLIINSHTIANY